VLLVALALACFALPPMAQAQLPSPPPDGGYPNGTTAEGDGALFSLTTGVNNSAFGYRALNHNEVGNDNTAVGYQALVNHIGETGSGFGNGNTAVGSQALYSDQIGFANTAVGWQALFNYNNTDEGDPHNGGNTAIGYQALYSDTIGGGNTATGAFALHNDRTVGGGFRGYLNTATGQSALTNNTTGSGNIALGAFAGDNLTTGDNNIDIGNDGVADEGNTIRIGVQGTQTRTFIAGIHGMALGSGVAVRVNANGRLGTAPSSARFKTEIKPMDTASEAIHALKPVTFYYKQEIDSEGTLQFGLVAEEVEKVNPDLVTRDDNGKPYTVRYEAVNAMLLNEFLKEHNKVEQLTKDFESKLAHQQKQIEALTAGLQKVTAQLEASKPAPQIVSSNQ
jgi:hypothetical protein